MAEEKKGGGSLLIKSEDWMAVWIGFLIIVLAIVIFKNDIMDLKKQLQPTLKWATDGQVASRVDKWSSWIDGASKEAQAKGEEGAVKRLQDLKDALAKGDRKEIAGCRKG